MIINIFFINSDRFRLKYFKKPDWFKEEMEAKKTASEDPNFLVIEMYKVDGGTEDFFRPKFK
jgi:hypothetical protein